jgi:hypothetical protein
VRATTEHCPLAVLVMSLQSIFGVIIQVNWPFYNHMTLYCTGTVLYCTVLESKITRHSAMFVRYSLSLYLALPLASQVLNVYEHFVASISVDPR